MLDLDDFKKLNDTFGHSLGDQALTHLVTVTRKCIRPQDSIIRYGGEEFLVLMPNTSIEQGVQTMKRLQVCLMEQVLTTSTASNNHEIHLMFSAGVAQYSNDESLDLLIKRADNAMYQAKHEGKNCIRTAD
jgi:diguanylate cyclase